MKIKKLFTIAIVCLFCLSVLVKPIKASTHNVFDEPSLRAAIIAASPGDIINFTDDIYLDNTINITAGIEVTFTGPFSLFGPNGATTIFVDETGVLIIDGIKVTHEPGATGLGIYIGLNPSVPAMQGGLVILKSGEVSGNTTGIYNNKGTLRIEGGSINNNITAGEGGGITCSSSGAIYMSGGSINNNQATDGGGIITNGPFYFSGGEITGNIATRHGGGVYAGRPSSTVIMTGGNITNNTAGAYGGGVVLGESATLIMSSGSIANNTAGAFGGGVFVSNSTFEISSGSISGNIGSDGGAVFVTYASSLTISGNVSITNNKAVAADGEGGGIYTQNYSNLNIGAQTYFGGNTAWRAYNPPLNADTLYTNMGYSHVSISTHPLNNFDINYDGNGDEPVTVVLTYHPNGGTGGGSFSGVARSVGVATASEAGVSRTGYKLTGWNTVADGSGTAYGFGDIISLDNNLTLYAQWQLVGSSPNTGDMATLPLIVFGFSLLSLVVTVSIKRRKLA